MKIKNIIGNLCSVLLLLLCCVLYMNNVIYAEAKKETLVTLGQTEDLVVMFTFDYEQTDITFISPSGKKYKEGTTNGIEAVHGELWSTYKIANAEAGEWKVEYDLKSNREIKYSVIDEKEGLWIQYFKVDNVEGTVAEVCFEADKGEENIRYNYAIYVIAGEDDSASKEIFSGNADGGEAVKQEIDLSNLTSYNKYRLKLEVYYTDEMEFFDSAVTDTFKFDNPNTPTAISNFKMYINESDNACRIDWSDFDSGDCDNYFVLAIADNNNNEPVYSEELENDTREALFYYPVGTKRLSVSLYYKLNGVLSQTQTKEIDIEKGEYLLFNSGEVSNSAQAILEYNITADRMLKVNLNETNTKEFLISKSGTMGIALEPGENTLYAEFESDNSVFYIVSKEVYYDRYPPEILLYENFDGKSFHTSEIVLRGKVKNGKTFFINGREVSLSEKQTFSYEVKLALGNNKIKLEATDANGNCAVQMLSVKRISNNPIITTNMKSYLPILISLAVSLVIIIFALIFMKKTNKQINTTKIKINKNIVIIMLDIILAVFASLSTYTFIQLYQFTTNTDFLSIAERSILESSKYVKYEKMMGIATLILIALLILAIIITIFSIKKNNEER